jgi:hypothetical protein
MRPAGWSGCNGGPVLWLRSPPAQRGRRGKEQQAELAEIEALIATGKVLSSRIVRTVINGRDTYRMQMVCDGHPTRRHPVGDGRVSFDLGPSEVAVAVEQSDGSSTGWIEPLADGIRLTKHRAVTPSTATSGPSTPRRVAGLLSPRRYPPIGTLRLAAFPRRQVERHSGG